MTARALRCGLLASTSALLSCAASGKPAQPICEIASGAAKPDYLKRLGCAADFQALASEPLDTSIPGARSLKVVLDRLDKDTLYFQNSAKYRIHHDFAAKHLSGPRLPLVRSLSEFNRTEYTSIDRRFILGAVTYYAGPKLWVLELAPYDTATAAMVKQLYDAVKAHAFFGPELALHPTSEAAEAVARTLPASVRIKSTREIFAGIDYQPLNLGTTIGKLRFLKASDLADTYVSFREIIVLDQVPNDISVVAGLVTEAFQTPLSHVNVLAQNRKTPNMGLRGATSNATLRTHEGKWVALRVGAIDWSLREATAAEADAWWEAHKPTPIVLPVLNLGEKRLANIEDVVPEPALPAMLGPAIRDAILAFGAKAANYSILARTPGVPIRKAFAIPVHYYVEFMRANGFFDRVSGLLASPEFANDPRVRDAKLMDLRKAIATAPVDPDFQDLLRTKLMADYPGQTMRFRTSTNAEDLAGFPCAGCYDSRTGDPADWDGLLTAVRKAWAGVWLFRTFEERAYHGIDHAKVGMALLVHHNFPAEEANGVALTANPFDPSGLEPGFYVNVQSGGDAEVVHPPPGVTSDEFIYFFAGPGQPVMYLTRSSLIPRGQSVLSAAQLIELGTALQAIHQRFSWAYGPGAGNQGWYAMDVEFKFDDEDAPDRPATLWIKQARPHPGRGN